jgi:actin-related protein
MASEVLMNLYSCGKINGIVVDMGHSFTTVDSVING